MNHGGKFLCPNGTSFYITTNGGWRNDVRFATLEINGTKFKMISAQGAGNIRFYGTDITILFMHGVVSA